MNTDTPRMQEAWDKSSRTADGFYSSQTPTSECATSCYDEGCKLEIELADAIRERDEARAIAAKYEDRYFSTLKERDEARGQRDRLAEILGDMKTLAEITKERDEAREQRDRLAEALREMWPFIEEDDLGSMNTPAFGAAIHKYKQALAELAKDIY